MSEIGNRITRSGQTHAMELILFPLFTLLIVGVVGNNLAISGLQSNPTEPTPFCQQIAICFPTNKTGCDFNQSNCNFTSTTTFAFLNPSSPFTFLFSGNVGGFVNQFTAPSFNNLATNQPFTFFSNASITNDLHPNDTGTTIFGICGNINGTSWLGPNGGNGGLNIKLQCNQNFINATQVPRTLNGLQYSKMFNNTPGHTLNCTSFNSQTSGGSVSQTKYVYFGCDTPSPIPASSKYSIVAVNATSESAAASGGNNTQLFAWILLTNQQVSFHSSSDPNYCALIVGFGGSFLSVANQPSFLCTGWGSAMRSTIGTANQGIFGTFVALGFIAGIIFLVLSLGIGLNVQILTSGLGLSPDDQGTKLMQVLGIGLFSWTIIVSEFGYWLTALTNNVGNIILLSLTLTFFMGLYWRLFAWD